MDVEDTRKALFGRIEDNWEGTPIAWPNRGHDPDGKLPEGEFDPYEGYWIRATLLPGKVFEGEIPESGVGIRAGNLVVDTFAPKNKGTRQALLYAKDLEALFRKKTIDGVMCGEPYTEDRGLDKN